VRGAVTLTLGVTTVRAKATGFWGVGARLLLGDFGLGGSGYVASGAGFVAVGQTNLRVDLGYGGLEFDAPLPWVTSEEARFSLLLGGGNAEVVEAAVGRELGADNFLVVEPRLLWSRQIAEFAQGTLALGYRAAFGVDDLPGIGGQQLSGPSLSLSVSILQRSLR